MELYQMTEEQQQQWMQEIDSWWTALPYLTRERIKQAFDSFTVSLIALWKIKEG